MKIQHKQRWRDKSVVRHVFLMILKRGYKSWVFSWLLETSMEEKNQIVSGKLFQNFGPTDENA